MRHTLTSMAEIPRRLDKYLRDSVGLSRSDCERAWQLGRISTSTHLSHLGEFVFPGDEVLLDGRAVALRTPKHTLIFHKPPQVVTTLREPSGRRCVGDWLAEMPAGVFPVGRLDAATTGLLLFSDDGDLAHMLMHPDHGITKTYILDVAGDVSEDDARLNALRDGVELDDGPARALHADVTARRGDASAITLDIDEGRTRIVRRMAKRVGFHLLHLHRVRVGSQWLGETVCGEWRLLDAPQIEGLWRAVGGRDRVARSQIAALRRRADHHRAEGRPFLRLEAWLDDKEFR
ncbi:MAG: pseudouridine synthase [bacterium]